jgi:hypothetical protein
VISRRPEYSPVLSPAEAEALRRPFRPEPPIYAPHQVHALGELHQEPEGLVLRLPAPPEET